MRIAIVTQHVRPNDGQGTVNLELANYMAEKGHEVHVFSLYLDQACAHPAIIHHKIRTGINRPALLRELIFVAQATWYLSRSNFDIIHLNGVGALRRHHVNTAHFVHSAWLRQGFSEVPGLRGLYHRVYRVLNAWWERIVFNQAKQVVAVSHKVAHELREACGISSDRITVIHNGTSLRGGERVCKPKGERIVIGFAGDLRTAVKGVETLLGAVRRLRTMLPGTPFEVQIAGATKGSPYPAMAEILGVDDVVRFVGFQSNMGAFLKSVDVFVYPTRYDPCPLVLIEAAAAGCALVTSQSRYCGSAELFRDGEQAVHLLDPTDEAGLADTMCALILDAALRERLGSAAAEAASQHTWHSKLSAYEMLYKRVASAAVTNR